MKQLGQESCGGGVSICLGRIARGDHDSFWQLWQSYGEDLRKLCKWRLSGNQEVVDDALSEAMLRAYHQLPRHAETIRNPRAWLCRLVANVCVDFQRRIRYKLSDINDMDDELCEWPGPNPEQQLLDVEQSALMASLISSLSPSLRDTFVLRVVDELSYQEIAEQQRISIDTARKRIQRARVVLKILVQGRSEDRPVPHMPSPEEIPELALVPSTLRHYSNESGGMYHDWFVAVPLPPARPQIRLRTLSKYEKSHPNGWKKRLERADLLRSLGSWQEAIGEYRRVISVKPRALDARVALADLLAVCGQKNEAIAELQAAAESSRSQAARLHLGALGHCYRGGLAETIRGLSRAQALEPDSSVHSARLGHALVEVEQPQQALACFDQVLTVYPGDVLTLMASCRAADQLGRSSEARRRAQAALQIDDMCVPALKYLADCRCRSGLVRNGPGAETRRLIRDMQRRAPESAQVIESLALYHYARGD
jgi:RNA polymerase sigma factor (sigma-70 family)